MENKPPARVVLITKKGKIVIELYADKLPVLTKAFIGNCVLKKFKGVPFDRVTTDIIQAQFASEDSSNEISTLKNSTLENSNIKDESSLKHQSSLKHEFHSRLRFDSKGTVGLVNLDDNTATADGFFITLKPTPELNSKYVLIGRVTSESFYNVLSILQGEMKPGSDSPVYPVTIDDIQVPEKYFDDIKEVFKEEKPQKQRKSIKMAFEEDVDEEDVGFVMKSAHELLGKTKETKKKKEDKEKETIGNVDKETKNVEKETIEKTGGTGTTDDEQNQHEDEKNQQDQNQNQNQQDQESKDKFLTMANLKGNNGIIYRISEELDPYDEILDFSDKDADFETLLNHKFICQH